MASIDVPQFDKLFPNIGIFNIRHLEFFFLISTILETILQLI